MRTYCYLELSPRGFGNEIEFTVSCSAEEYNTLKDIYDDGKRKSWKVPYSKLGKRFIADASDVIELLQTKDDNRRWAIHEKIRKQQDEHEMYR